MASDNASESAGKAYPPLNMDFSELVMGFASAALYYLGEAPLEGREKPTKNLPLAKQNIDILELLKDKTRGNLTDEEQRLIDHVLVDLRLKFVEVSKAHP